jgi:hypothetical protein
VTTPSEQPQHPLAPKTSRRETLIAILCGLGVLAFLGYGVMTMGSRQQKATSNTLTGKVVGKKFTPAPEDQVTFGRGGVKSQHLAGEYVFEVEVKSENRVFHVPVDAATYEAVRIGSSFSFMRPRREQKK